MNLNGQAFPLGFVFPLQKPPWKPIKPINEPTWAQHRPKTAQHWPDIALQVPPKYIPNEKFSFGIFLFPPETSMEAHKAHQMTQHGPNIDPRRLN